jgi:hypothetical protein
MRQTVRWLLAFGILIAVVALAIIGQRVSPAQQGPTSGGSRSSCEVEASDALRAAADQWCANGLFSRVSITGDDQDVIAVAQFSTNGSQIWQIQNAGLLATFPGLTDKIAAGAQGKNVSMSVHDAADRRVAVCARMSTAASATCEMK